MFSIIPGRDPVNTRGDSGDTWGDPGEIWGDTKETLGRPRDTWGDLGKPQEILYKLYINS